VKFVKKFYNEISNICGYAYRARWYICQDLGEEIDENGLHEKRKVCKVMNYLRFNKCVEYGYQEMVVNKKIVMNYGYSNVKVKDFSQPNSQIIDSSVFFKNLLN
jgi:hypothetical protein